MESNYIAGRTAMLSIEKFREHVRKRNLEILERRRCGETRRSLAQRFGLDSSRIDVILREFVEEQRLTNQSNRLLEAIRQANDLDRPWPVGDLIDTIRPLLITRIRLKEFFAVQQTTHLSLRTLLEMTSPMVDEAGLVSALPRLLVGVRGVGKKGFWSVVDRLTNLDLGILFNQE
jgi:hypothetical protein